MPTGFPVHVRFDASTDPTAAEIYAASLSATKGDDIRIVHNNQTQLDRVIYTMQSNQIDIWFPIQAGLGGGQTDSTNYQIYYGNASASSPPANSNNVFLPHADGNTMGLWHFQEGSGSTIHDISGRSHNGSFVNGAWGDGYLGRAGVFNGSSSYVEVGHSDDFKPGAITFETWVYANAFGAHIFDKDGYWIRINNDGEISLVTKAGGGDRYLAKSDGYHPEWVASCSGLL